MKLVLQEKVLHFLGIKQKMFFRAGHLALSFKG
jgi:hypothetical protein